MIRAGWCAVVAAGVCWRLVWCGADAAEDFVREAGGEFARGGWGLRKRDGERGQTTRVDGRGSRAVSGWVVPKQINRENIAGAVVLVVKDGKVLYSKGYGYADVEKKTPVTPDTLFRPGSVSKLFTWTAVMQQVQPGKIDLDANINQYLDFKIPETFPSPSRCGI